MIFGQIKRKICQLIRRLLDGFAVNMICFCGCSRTKVHRVCVCVRVWPHNFLSLGSASCCLYLWDANQNWLISSRGNCNCFFFSLLIALLIAIFVLLLLLLLLPPPTSHVACGKCSALSIYGNVARFLLPIASLKYTQHNITSHSTTTHNCSCTLTYIPHTLTHTHNTHADVSIRAH